jgi:hypothetical protein
MLYFTFTSLSNSLKMMEKISTLNVTGTTSEKRIIRDSARTLNEEEKTMDNPVMSELIAKGGENFFNYLEWHGLTNDDNMLVLSSRHHYYYDPNELQAVTTLINVKHLDTFLHSIENVLSPASNFIGCFSDWKTQKGTGIPSRMYKGFINFIDSKIDVDYDKKDVSKLLESHGFKVMDMTEINGLTYFRAQNLGMQAN